MLKFHGIMSILLIIIAFILGCYQIFIASFAFGLIYIGLFLLTYFFIYTLYCSKCPADIKTCPHVFQGALKLIFPVKKEGDYTKFDYGVIILGFLAIVLFPQYWLKNNLVLLIVFWIIIVLALFQIRTFVCTGCCNKKCRLCRNSSI
jgi:hypothetical protein